MSELGSTASYSSHLHLQQRQQLQDHFNKLQAPQPTSASGATKNNNLHFPTMETDQIVHQINLGQEIHNNSAGNVFSDTLSPFFAPYGIDVSHFPLTNPPIFESALMMNNQGQLRRRISISNGQIGQITTHALDGEDIYDIQPPPLPKNQVLDDSVLPQPVQSVPLEVNRPLHLQEQTGVIAPAVQEQARTHAQVLPPHQRQHQQQHQHQHPHHSHHSHPQPQPQQHQQQQQPQQQQQIPFQQQHIQAQVQAQMNQLRPQQRYNSLISPVQSHGYTVSPHPVQVPPPPQPPQPLQAAQNNNGIPNHKLVFNNEVIFSPDGGPIPGTAAWKKARLLERNRIAASKCRQRKKAAQLQLREELEKYQVNMNQLSSKLEDFEKLYLKMSEIVESKRVEFKSNDDKREIEVMLERLKVSIAEDNERFSRELSDDFNSDSTNVKLEN